MNAKKCDRCGKYYEPRQRRYTYLLAKYGDKSIDYTEPVDLCKDCSNELYDWFCMKSLEESDGETE